MPDDMLDLSVAPPEAPEVDVDPIGEEDGDDWGEPVGLGPSLSIVDETMVRRLLKIAGDTAHAMSGDIGHAEPEFLRFTDGELDALTPPLTAYINARPRLQRAVARGDGVAVVLTLLGWTGRNVAAYRRYQTETEETTSGNEYREDDRARGGDDAGASDLDRKLGALAAARAGIVRGADGP